VEKRKTNMGFLSVTHERRRGDLKIRDILRRAVLLDPLLTDRDGDLLKLNFQAPTPSGASYYLPCSH